MAICVYCKAAKGKRACPALAGYICSSCCGKHRGIELSCPSSCRYFKEHEAYQQERLGENFLQEWLKSTEELYKQDKTKVLDFIIILELLLYQYYRSHTRGNDDDILEALEFLKRRFSPIEVVEAAGSALGNHLWVGVQEYLKKESVEKEEALEGVEATIKFLKSYSGGDENPRRYLHGLLGHVERHFKLPQELKEEPSAIITPEIVTPEELRRFSA